MDQRLTLSFDPVVSTIQMVGLQEYANMPGLYMVVGIKLTVSFMVDKHSSMLLKMIRLVIVEFT